MGFIKTIKMKKEILNVVDLEKRLQGSDVSIRRFLPKEAFTYSSTDPKNGWIEDFKIEFYSIRNKKNKIRARITGTYHEFYFNGAKVGKHSQTVSQDFKKWVAIPSKYFSKNYTERLGFNSKVAFFIYGKRN
ncbi:hypothetical protein ACFLZZ_02840 [Nanoarchaeota archaeon]